MPAEIEMFLAGIGVEYKRWTPAHPISADASSEEILQAYEPDLRCYRSMHKRGVYDVIDLPPETLELEGMLNRFKKEHWHDEDEAHLIIDGCGAGCIHPVGRPVTIIQVERGDFISVGRGILHWFEPCAMNRLRVIRFLAKPEGHATDFTQSGIESEYEPVCLGPEHSACRCPQPRV